MKKKKGKWTKGKEVWQYQLDIPVGGGGHSVASEDPQNHTKNTWQYCPHCGKRLQ
jgi:hypothetical protein